MPRLRRAVCASLVIAFCSLASQASAATITATVPSGATEDLPVTVTLTGTAESPLTLFAAVVGDVRLCQPSAALQSTAAGSTLLTAVGGTGVGPGAFSREFTFTPTEEGGYRVCAFLTATGQAPATAAAADLPFPIVAPASPITVTLEPTTYEPTQALNGRVTASSPVPNRELRFGWSTSGSCANITPPITAIALTAGVPVERTASTLAADGISSYRLCASVVELPAGQPESSAEAVSTAVPREVILERWRPVSLTNEGDQDDRLRLRWKTRSLHADEERLEIWDSAPEEGDDPVLSETLDSESLELLDTPVGEQAVRVRTFLGFRQFWWRVGTDTSAGERVWSQINTVSVVPSEMVKRRTKVSPKFTAGYSTRRPGTVRLRITSSPRARVTLEVRYRGRVFTKRRYTEGVGKLRGIDFRLTCSQPGRFSYVVTMRDPYGNKATHQGWWATSAGRCASLRAKEQRKAAAEARRREEARRPKPSNGGDGSGGSGCAPGYSPQCLEQGAGDYDCSGGSGDGPNYVSGPVNVSGSDPFDLDRDGDGVGCES